MQIVHLSLLDWLVIAIYFAFVLGIGLYLRRFMQSGADFFLAGRKSSSWASGLAFLSANLGALEILGWTGGTMKYGTLVAHFYWIGAVPAMLFLALYMMPFYYSSRIHSVPGYLRLRFDERTRLLNAVTFAVMTLLMSGVNLYLMALVLRAILGWDWQLSMWISAISVAGYIALGGLMSAIFTEIMQFFVIWFGLFLVAILGSVELGGLDKVFSGVPAEMGRLWATTGDPAMNSMGVTWAAIVMGLGFVLSFGYWTTDFLIVQRAFSARDLRAARQAPIIASFFKMALPFIIVVSGLVAWQLARTPGSGFTLLPRPDSNEPWNDSAMPLLIARYYPPGLVGLGITALLAGFMAGQAGNISAFNTVWTYDIYRVLIRPNADDRELVRMGRFVTLVGVLLSIATAYLAMQFGTIMDYIQAIFSWVNAPLFATMLLGMFWQRATSAGAFIGLLSGMLSSFSIFLGFRFSPALAEMLTFSSAPSDMTKNLWQAIWAWCICFAVTVIVSFFSKPKTAAELEGLVKGLTPATDDGAVAWFRRPATWAAVSALLLVALNLFFY